MIAYIITGVICFALGGVFGVFVMALLAAEKRNTSEPEYKSIIKLQPIKLQPSEAEVRMAACVIKEYCENRDSNPETDCTECPIRDICLNEPYLWEVKP